MEANLRKCLITTRQSLFCILFFGFIIYILLILKTKRFPKSKKVIIMKLKTFKTQQTII
jgi:hypothetical protein